MEALIIFLGIVSALCVAFLTILGGMVLFSKEVRENIKEEWRNN